MTYHDNSKLIELRNAVLRQIKLAESEMDVEDTDRQTIVERLVEHLRKAVEESKP